MTTEGEQQEAVCGTCGGDCTRGLIENYELRIPAPVVPSDDECQACNGEGGGYVSVGANEWDAQQCDVCRGTGRRPVLPTPSQDAEGDGLAEGDLRQKAEEWEIDYRRWNRLPTKQAYAQHGARRVGFIAGFKAALESLGGRS